MSAVGRPPIRLTPEELIMGIMAFYRALSDSDYADIRKLIRLLPPKYQKRCPDLSQPFSTVIASFTWAKDIVKVMELPNTPRTNYILSFRGKCANNKVLTWEMCIKPLRPVHKDIVSFITCRL